MSATMTATMTRQRMPENRKKKKKEEKRDRAYIECGEQRTSPFLAHKNAVSSSPHYNRLAFG